MVRFTRPYQPIRRMGALAVLGILVAMGCGGSDQLLENLPRDLETLGELTTELELGTYRIASAISAPSTIGDPAKAQWVHIRFQLYAMVPPDDVERVKAICKRRQGTLDDTVLTICRGASVEDLQDIRNTTLKSRLIDAIRPILGANRIQQISFADTFVWEPI